MSDIRRRREGSRVEITTTSTGTRDAVSHKVRQSQNRKKIILVLVLGFCITAMVSVIHRTREGPDGVRVLGKTSFSGHFHKRVVFAILDDSRGSYEYDTSHVRDQNAVKADTINVTYISSGSEKDVAGSRQSSIKHQEEEKDCFPLHSWQTRQYSSCNLLHEITSDPTELVYIDKGRQSTVLQVKSASSLFSTEEVVLKAQNYRLALDKASLEQSRKNALVHERLTSSPYVASIYGSCALSMLVPYAPGGTLMDWLLSLKDDSGTQQQSPSSLDKLRMGVQVAEGLAALHGMDKYPSFAHRDLDLSQYVYRDGVFQLNDFHAGQFLFETNTSCSNTHEEDEGNKKRPLRPDRADVFSMCNEFHSLFPTCGLLDRGNLRRNICYRVISNVTDQGVTLSAKRSGPESVMVKAMKMCWTQNPEDMASAGEVASFLREELHKLEGKRRASVVKVTLPGMQFGS